MTADERRELEITTRTTEILAQKLDAANWPVVQNAARSQAATEWDQAHAQDSWEGPHVSS